MATKPKAAATTDVLISRSALKQFINLATGLENADNAYKTCQSTLFRDYARGAYKSANMRAAVAQAKEALGDE